MDDDAKDPRQSDGTLTDKGRALFAEPRPAGEDIDRWGYWAGQLIDEHWMALYRFAWRNGPVLVGVHVVPREPPAGIALSPERPRLGAITDDEWSRFLSRAAIWPVPPHAISARMLRQLRPRDALGDRLMDPKETILLGLLGVEGWSALSEHAWRLHQQWLGWVEPDAAAARPPEPRLHRLARVAQLYAAGVAAARPRLNADIADLMGRRPSQVRDDVYAARREGLLTEGSGQGRSGGTLTDKARALLAELDSQEGAKR